MIQKFIIAGESSCSATQIEDRLLKGFDRLEIITYEDQFKGDFDQHLKVNRSE